MARDRSELDDERIDETTDENGDTTSNNVLLGRRSYLKAAGATSLVTAGLAATSIGAASSDFTVIEVGPGETWEYQLDDGEVFENYLIDITATGAEAELWARANDWVIRNVGFKGRWDTTRRGNFINAMVPNAASTGLIENVYIGDGAATTNYPNSPNGVFVPRPHAGELTIRNLHVQHLADNAVYGSPPGQAGAGDGAVIIEDSYCRDIQPAGWRVGGSGSRIENCVAINAHRGIWNRFSEIDVIDCDIADSRLSDIEVRSGRVGGNTPTVNAENTRFGTTNEADGPVVGGTVGGPRRTDPDDVAGVPLSAEEAASGSTTAADDGSASTSIDDPDDDLIEDAWSDEEANHIIFEATSGNLSEYRVTGFGNAEPGADANTDPDDPYRDTVSVDGDEFVVEGYLGGYRDDFYLEGRVESVDVDSGITVSVNGTEIDPAELEGVGSWDESADADAEDHPHVLVIDGTEASGPTTYSFSVDGSIVKSEYMGASIDDDDEIDGNTVRGVVADWLDAYRFSGGITDFKLFGEAGVHLEFDVDK